MKQNDLKRLTRAELLEMLIRQSKEVQQLREELEEAKAALENRSITISRAGSIAEASLQLSGVFDAAQNAANQYLENVCKTELDCQAMLEETAAKCEEMERAAQENSRKWWTETSRKLEEFYVSHPGLREMLAQQLETSERGSEE